MKTKTISVYVLLMTIIITAVPVDAQVAEGEQPGREKIAGELFSAARGGDLERLKELLTRYPDMKDVDERGWSLLHQALESGEMVEYLIGLGVDIEAKSGALWTPLHSHAYYGHKEGVELLLEHGADIEAKTSFGMTPLLSSLRWDRIEVARFLLEKGADADAATALGRTALIVSTIEGNLDMVKLFLDGGADVSIRDNNYGMTALHFAALYGQLDIAGALLKKGADLEVKDVADRTPFYYANRYGHGKVARLLKSSSAEGEIDEAHFGYSPLIKKSLKEGEAFAWYMGQSGYAIKTKDHFLLFNYNYSSGSGQPAEPHLANGRIDLGEIDGCKATVFACSPHHSHHHPEGFREWQNTHRDIAFIYTFEDTLGRDTRYFKDVPGPEYIYIPGGEKKTVQGIDVEAIPVTSAYRDADVGFLVEVDGLTIFYASKHILYDESQREAFRRPIDMLNERGIEIDILVLPGNYGWGRIFPINIEGVEYAVETLRPRALLVSGGDSTEFVLLEVAAAMEKYQDQTKTFCPEHRGDLFILKD